MRRFPAESLGSSLCSLFLQQCPGHLVCGRVSRQGGDGQAHWRQQCPSVSGGFLTAQRRGSSDRSPVSGSSSWLSCHWAVQPWACCDPISEITPQRQTRLERRQVSLLLFPTLAYSGLLLRFIARSLSALIAHSNPSLSFPFSLLSLLLLRHVAEQAKSQHCFRREPLVLSAVTWEERSQLARKGVREREKWQEKEMMRGGEKKLRKRERKHFLL